MASERIKRMARRGDRNAVNVVVTEKINAVREALNRLEETLDCEG